MFVFNLFINVLNLMVNFVVCFVLDKLGCRYVMLLMMKIFMLDLFVVFFSCINNFFFCVLKLYFKLKLIFVLIRFLENLYCFVYFLLEYLLYSWDIFIL